MKQVAQNYRSGELTVLDVPEPTSAAGGVLVRSLYSLISSGTELMKISESKMSLVGKARARPDQVKKVLDTVVQQGPMSAYHKAMNRLDSYTPLGYSLAGVVEEVGAGAEEFSVGQLVACAGNEYALHAEMNWVPTNLCVPVPKGVLPQWAAFATVGAIAMQGVRQAAVQLGDTACVIGLGLVGQLVVQLLVAAGVRVVGLDVVPDRCRLAEKAGATVCAEPDDDGVTTVETALRAASHGLGADHVFLVAGGSSNTPVEVAARLARDRGTVVDIGKCSLDLPWNAYYEKELDVRFSRSYGPGRYDARYEVQGIDYPAGYVRWTERRNLACFVDLAASGALDLDPLISATVPIADAVDLYERLSSGTLAGVGFLFEYPRTSPRPTAGPEPGVAATGPSPARVSASGDETRVRPAAAGNRGQGAGGRDGRAGMVRVGFVGAGNYASSMLLPHLVGRPDTELTVVATRRSLSAANAQRRFGFTRTTTDVEDVLGDESLDAVFVVTRHSTHAELTCRALERGLAVFVEKPLALDDQGLQRIVETVDATGNDRLFVGFNRRFAPMLVDLRERFGAAPAPMFARYHVNAGVLAADSWYRDSETEGSRFVGEGGHFIDTVSWWMHEDPVELLATTDGPDLCVQLWYPGGSLAAITYATSGHPRAPKETFEVNGGGRSARLDNFKRATLWSGRRRKSVRTFGSPDKGQANEVRAFLDAVRDHQAMPVPLSSLVATTRATLAVSGSVASRAVTVL